MRGHAPRDVRDARRPARESARVTATGTEARADMLTFVRTVSARSNHVPGILLVTDEESDLVTS
jgi:hypothetical protein